MPDAEKKSDFLPYRTTKEKFEGAIDALRTSPGSGDAVNVAVGESDRRFVTKTLATLGIVRDVSDLELTELGRTIAYSNGDDRRRAILRALAVFPPYKAILMEAALRRAESLAISDIASIWGQKAIGSDDDARESGAIVLAALMDSAGLGKHSLGRRGKPSRIDLVQGWQTRFMSVLGSGGASPIQPPSQPMPEKASSGSVNPQTQIEGFVQHSFLLRRGMVIEIHLPNDLTAKEVSRLSKWLATLPLEDGEAENN